MSGLLLDTHVLLWALTDPGRLGEQTIEALSRETCHVSAASTWEIAIKASLGKLAAPDDLADQILAAGFVELPVVMRHTTAAPAVELPQKDPFDRLLVAQAAAEAMTFVTADTLILGAGLDGVLDARL